MTNTPNLNRSWVWLQLQYVIPAIDADVILSKLCVHVGEMMDNVATVFFDFQLLNRMGVWYSFPVISHHFEYSTVAPSRFLINVLRYVFPIQQWLFPPCTASTIFLSLYMRFSPMYNTNSCILSWKWLLKPVPSRALACKYLSREVLVHKVCGTLHQNLLGLCLNSLE